MNSLIQKKVSIPENVLFRELAGESVVLDINTEKYFGLDDVGTRMWILLSKSDSVQQAYEALLEEYDVDPDSLRKDLVDLLTHLVDKGLLVVDDTT